MSGLVTLPASELATLALELETARGPALGGDRRVDPRLLSPGWSTVSCLVRRPQLATSSGHGAAAFKNLHAELGRLSRQ